MSEHLDVARLVKQAQGGDKGALDRLAALATQRLRPYIYRITLQEDLAEEIVQETLLEMVMILGKLKNTDRFWPWLYGIATNKLRHHYRTEQSYRRAGSTRSEEPIGDREEGLERLVTQEIKQAVTAAMKALKTRYRAVLVMRCYDGMSYAEIAQALGCTEFGSRMLFLRAKKALEKQLALNGLKKGSLLGALVLFGKLTAPSEAAAAQITISAATLEVGLAASIAGLATSKAVVTTAAGIVGIGAVVGPRLLDLRPEDRSAVAKVDQSYTFNLLGDHAGRPQRYWYFLPDGPGGPLLLRAQVDGGLVVLQNASANYVYEGGVLYINNHRYWAKDLSVVRLPTDPPAMTQFLDQVEGRSTKAPYTRSMAKGLLVEVAYRAAEGYSEPEVIVNPNVSDEDYFQYDWPVAVAKQDQRDQMRTRGWTYFTVAGQIRGQPVTGQGRMAFYYQNYLRARPWLQLGLPGLSILDPMDRPAVVVRSGQDATHSRTTIYPGGSFFKGLMRPWAGLHTLDIVRRDAAEARLWFRTIPSQPGGWVQVEVDLANDLKAVYTIDLEADLIEQIELISAGRVVGQLQFAFAQELTGAVATIQEPSVIPVSGRRVEEPGVLWLARLAEGTLE
ncbi:MAG: sigma-70 family RNA polymerase sigma factor [Sedimentisphaerales bacterium]|nr:sigma-70 family RNA polymerase sigma factor [Sedimentisphaerales bacterium]